MHFKPKIIQRLTAALTAAAITLTALSNTALAGEAFTGDSTGTAIVPSYGDYPYGYSGNNLSWRIDLYVSANNDGKIDPVNDKIDSAALPWIGGVILTTLGSNAYIQCDYTANRKPLQNAILDSTYDEDGFVTHDFNLPHCYQNTTSLLDMDDPTGRKVYVAHDTYNLPTDCGTVTDATYESKVKNIIESKAFATSIIDKISSGMGGSDYFLANAVSKLKGMPYEKVFSAYKDYKAGNCSSEDVMNLRGIPHH